jgi:hypothetical protein
MMTRTHLKSLALIAATTAMMIAMQSHATPASGEGAIKPVIVFKAMPFELQHVRLLDGPFKRAMELDAAYLLRLEPDRLLSWFRKEAGLAPKGEVYGGWESDTIAGHSLGHYLSACAMMSASTDDARFKERISYIVDELELCQNANGDGFLAAFPNGKKAFAEIAAGDIRPKPFELNGIWVPWYSLHKLFAGLLDAQHYCANEKALAIAIKLADWAEATTANLTEEQFQHMLDCEHGGMNDVLAELYARTGNQKYLNLSRRFHHRAVLEPLAKREDRLKGLHSNTQIPKLIGLARRYELTGEATDRTAAEFFWERVVYHHSYVIGGHSMSERFGPPDSLDARLADNTAETCKTYNMLKLTRHLFQWHAAANYADYYERALYNHILASQNPNDGMMCYYVPLRPGARKVYSTPFESFWCCVGSGIENHAKYGDSIYFYDKVSEPGRTNDGLWVNLFIASELRWKEKGLVLRQETRYPEVSASSTTEATRLALTCEKPVKLTLRLRYPAWANNGISISVNGKLQKVSAIPGSFVEINRTWKTGDHVDVKIPMALRLEAMPDNPNRVAVLYGPIVLAGDLGPEKDPAARKSDYVPAFLAQGKPPQEWIKPVEGQPLRFRTVDAGRPREVTLSAFYGMHNRRYSVYWDLITPEQWAQRQEAFRAENERLRKLEAATIDFVQPGNSQQERDHNLQGEKTRSGGETEQTWRHAVDGGWFSFDLQVKPDQPMALVCTYWGSDAGNRTFDILVDGSAVATQSLNRNKPGAFFDVTYPIPEELTRGKQKVTVRFRAHAGSTAGGVFGVRMAHGGGVPR